MTTEVTILEKIFNKIDHLEQRFDKRFDKVEADINTVRADLKDAVDKYQNQRSADVRWFVGIITAIMVSMMAVSFAALMMNAAT